MILCWSIVALHCCLCLLCCKVNQLHVCTYPLLFGFPSQSGVHRAMSWVAYACYTVGSHWLSMLYTVVYIRQPQSPHLAHSALFPVVSMFVPYICVSISPGSFSFELCPVTTQHVVNKPTQTPFRVAARASDRTGSRSHSAQLTWTHTAAPAALLDEVCSHGLGEADHGCLGCAIHTPVHNSWEGNKGSVARRVRLSVTPWTVARQAPLSVGFSRQEHWSGLPCPPPGGPPDPGMETGSPALQADALPLSQQGISYLRRRGRRNKKAVSFRKQETPVLLPHTPPF